MLLLCVCSCVCVACVPVYKKLQINLFLLLFKSDACRSEVIHVGAHAIKRTKTTSELGEKLWTGYRFTQLVKRETLKGETPLYKPWNILKGET